MANRIQLRRGGAQEWANENPTLAQGEIGIELDTNRFKIGDGVRGWNTLPYERPIESVANTANTLVVRDADGNFSAGSITATVIGNAATASRLANPRQIQLSSDLAGSGTFDGSGNLSIAAQLQILTTLPHYDGTTTSTGDYTKLTVDAKGRITNASQPSSYVDLGLTDVQPLDTDLTSIAGLTATGLLCRASAGNMVPRTINGSSGRISVVSGSGVAGNPTIDLPDTTIAAEAEFISNSGVYAAPALISVGGDSLPTNADATVNTAQFTVDQYGRFTSAETLPIATAIEGSKYAAYGAGTTYVRYDIIENASKVYQAITGIAAGGGAPTHTDSSDTGGWRYLAAAKVEQKGLASFAQEDFDVDDNGHVSIAAQGVDNTQLQNNRLSFSDNNTQQNFELDQELTVATSHHGFDYLNYIKINDTSGNLLFGANNTGDGGAGEIDINVRSYFSDADVTFDGATNQTISKTGDGNFTLGISQNSASARNLTLVAANTGAGTSNVVIQSEDTVTINATESTGKVHVEDSRFQDNYIATTNATMYLDPGDDRAVTGTVVVSGDLQVDGTTTTVNSTTLAVDDPIVTLGGDTAPVSDDNKDRGVEFRYYDASAKVGFFGYDDSATDLGGHTGAFSFLYDATNTSEVFSGTDAGIIAGNLKLTTNTNSTSNTTGDLVVAGGAGIGDDVNIGGLLDVDGTFRANSTSRFDDTMELHGASKSLQFKNGSGTLKSEIHTTSGNAEFGGVVTVTGNTDLNSNLNVASLVHFESTDNPNIISGAPHTIGSSDYGALRVDGGGYFDKDVLFNGDIYLNGDFNQQEDATENYGLRNYLSVRYKMRAGSVAAYTPSYSNHNTSNLRVYGGAGINTTLHIGATGSGEGLFVGKKASGDTVKFSVDGPTGNTVVGISSTGSSSVGTFTVHGDTTLGRDVQIDGDVTVTGATEFNSTVDVDADFAVRNGTTDKFFVDNVTGNTNIEGTLTADGHTELNSTLNVDSNTTIGGTLEVTNNSEFNGTVDVDGNFAVRSGTTDKATIASSSGNIATDGTLVVAGQTTINDSLIVQSDNEVVNINNGSGTTKFSIDTDNGNTNIIGTLTVGDATQINDTLGVSNVVTFTRNTQQTLTGSYAADGAFQLTGGAAIGKNVAIGEGLRVYGGTELTGALDLNNSADISGALVTHDNVTITADNKEFAIQNGSAADKFTVDTDNGNTDIRGTLDVGGDVTAESNLTITGNLTVNGTTTTVNSTITTYDDPVITLGGDTAPGSNDGKDRGVEFRYYDGSAKIGFFGYDRSSSQFAFLTSATNTSEVLAGTDGALRAGSLNLTAAGTALDVDNDANIDGALTVDGQIVSNKSSGAPFSIASTTKVNNLNVDLLDGMTTASANTASTVVNRDASGDFAANQITAASATGAGAGFLGNASTADTWKTARVLTIDGVVNGNVSIDGSAAVTLTTTYDDADITALAAQSGTGYMVRTAANTYAHRTFSVTASSGITLTNPDGISGNTTINVASASSNASNNLVIRDGSGDFAANEITSDLVGNLTGATSTAKDLNPAADSTYDLGTSSVRWQGIFADAANITAITGALTGNVTGQVSDISNHDTGALSEGSNLYFTNERVDDRVNALIVAGTGITKVYDDAAGTYTLTVTQVDVNTDNVTEGSTNLFTTAARTRTHFTYGTGITHDGSGALSVTQADINTDNVTEGSTNLFTTAARTRTHFTYGTGITHNSGTLSVTQADIDTDNVTEGSTNVFFTNARADARIAAADTDDLSEGSTNLYYTDARANVRLSLIHI